MLLWWSYILTTCPIILGAVLDPALYLSPGPPLSPTSDSIRPEVRWSQNEEPRVERDTELLVVPLDKDKIADSSTTPKSSDSMETSETVWLGYRPRSIGLYGLPVSFSISGTYGSYGTGNNQGIIASNYAFNKGINTRGGAALAGSSYGSYGLGNFGGTRLYGGNPGASWSGWGNGKWGHYGKG